MNAYERVTISSVPNYLLTNLEIISYSMIQDRHFKASNQPAPRHRGMDTIKTDLEVIMCEFGLASSGL
jgi:hypothetical protein